MAPYRFSAQLEKPHVRQHTKFLVFIGRSCDDLSEFPAEPGLRAGREIEPHRITTPTIAMQPKMRRHLSLRVLRQDAACSFRALRSGRHGDKGP